MGLIGPIAIRPRQFDALVVGRRPSEVAAEARGESESAAAGPLHGGVEESDVGAGQTAPISAMDLVDTMH